MKKVIEALSAIAAMTFVAAFITIFVFKNEQIRDDYVNSAQSYVVALTNVEGNSGGTGFYVKANSGRVYILTNAHVCGLAEHGRIYVDRTFSAPVISIYPKHDLCLVGNVTDHSGLSVARSARNGEDVYVVGHPLLEPTSQAKGQIAGEMIINVFLGYNIDPCEGPTYSKIDLSQNPIADLLGIKYACIRTLDSNPVTANILPGNSGSPVLNVWRNVVGVAFAGHDGSARGFIVPLDYVKDFLSKF